MNKEINEEINEEIDDQHLIWLFLDSQRLAEDVDYMGFILFDNESSISDKSPPDQYLQHLPSKFRGIFEELLKEKIKNDPAFKKKMKELICATPRKLNALYNSIANSYGVWNPANPYSRRHASRKFSWENINSSLIETSKFCRKSIENEIEYYGMEDSINEL